MFIRDEWLRARFYIKSTRVFIKYKLYRILVNRYPRQIKRALQRNESKRDGCFTEPLVAMPEWIMSDCIAHVDPP